MDAKAQKGPTWFVLACAAAVSFTIAPTAYAEAAPQETTTVASLLAAEDRLFAADAHHDAAAVAQGFADEAIFVHANGDVQTKAQYIRALEGSSMPVTSIVAQDRVARVFGDVGVVRGVKKLVVGDLHLSGTYLTVYVMRDGHWQMLDEQSSPAPGAHPPR